MVGRPPAREAIDSPKAQDTQIERVNESTDHPHRLVFVDVIFEPIRQQKSL